MTHLPVSTLCLILVASEIVLLFLHRYFPSQDGPIHLEQSWIWHQLWNDPGSFYQRFFFVDLSRGTNLLGQLIMAQLNGFVGPLVAERIFLSFIVALFPFAFGRLLRSLDAPSQWPLIPITLLSLNFPLFLGSYNFCLATGLSVLALSRWVVFRRGESRAQALLFLAVFLLSFLAHPMPPALAIGLIVLYEFLRAFRNRCFDLGLRSLLVLGLTLYPFWKLFLQRETSEWSEFSFDIAPLSTSLSELFPVNPLHLFGGPMEILISWQFFSLIALVFMATLLLPKVRSGYSWGSIVPALFFVVFIASPWRVMAIGFFRERIALLFFLSLCASFAFVPLALKWERRLSLFFLVLAIQLFALRQFQFARINSYFEEYLSIGQSIPRESSLVPVVYGGCGPQELDPPLSDRICPFEHFAGAVAVERGLIEWDNFTALHKTFPVQFRPEARPSKLFDPPNIFPPSVNLRSHERDVGIEAEYVLVWGFDPQLLSYSFVKSLLRDLSNRYELTQVTVPRGLGRLYRKRRPPSDPLPPEGIRTVWVPR